MRRRLGYGAAVALLAALGPGCGGTAVEFPATPVANALVVVIDTQRADRFGCYGGPAGLTPFLDELAARSIVFHHAYAAAPWTEPSVASILTSRLPSEHGVRLLTSVLPEEETTLPEALHEHGIATQGFTANVLLGGRGFDQGFEDWTALPMGTDDAFVEPAHLLAATEGVLREAAVTWALGLPPERRGFLYLQAMRPHFAAVPDGGVLERIAASRGRWPFDVAALQRTWFYLPDQAPPDQLRDYYDALVASLDRGLAGLFDDLRRTGFLDRAVVVVTADHGEELFDHGHVGHGYSLYEEVLHVPLLVSLPGQRTRLDVDATVSLLDLAPTLLDLLGLPAPPSFGGRSLRDVVARANGPVARLRHALGRPAPDERRAPAELVTLGDPAWARKTPHRRALVGDGRKLLELEGGGYVLLDLRKDPGERSPRLLPADEATAMAPAWVAERTTVDQAAPARPLSPEETERLRALGYVR